MMHMDLVLELVHSLGYKGLLQANGKKREKQSVVAPFHQMLLLCNTHLALLCLFHIYTQLSQQ